VQGSGFKVQGTGFRVQGSGFHPALNPRPNRHGGGIGHPFTAACHVLWSGWYLRLIDSCTTQLKAQGPSRTCNESKEEEEEEPRVKEAINESDKSGGANRKTPPPAPHVCPGTFQ